MRTYTIIGGVNGVGKSSFTGVLKERCTDLGIIIDVDKITAELGGNALAGGKAALKKINECIEKGVSFTQETTLSGRRTEATAREVVEKGYRVRLYYIGLDSAAESISRIANRVRPGRLCRRFYPIVTRLSSTTMTTALCWWQSIGTENFGQWGALSRLG